MVDQPPSLSRRGPHVAEIRFLRPGSANRIEPDDLSVLSGYLTEIEADLKIHVVVLSAEGKVFSAGYHLGALTHRADGPRENHFERFANRLEALRAVTIASINGAVVGGSTDIALACDLRIGADTASLMMPAGRIGLPLYASALERYVARLGIDVAKRLIFLGEKISASEMKAIGFLSEIVPVMSLAQRVNDVAADLASLPRAPLAAMKAALNATARGGAISIDLRTALASAFDAVEIQRRIDHRRNGT